MKWLRIRLTDYDELVFPSACPNCLRPVSGGTLEIERKIVIPLVVWSVTVHYRVPWPHCDECIAFEGKKSKYRRTRWIAGLAGLVAAVFLAVGLAEGGSVGIAFWLLLPLGCWGMLVVALIAEYLRRTSVESDELGRASRTFAVKIYRKGTGLSLRTLLDIAILRATYAEEFIALNQDQSAISYSERRLREGLELEDLAGGHPAGDVRNLERDGQAIGTERSESLGSRGGRGEM